jgi:hypothetical protein
MWPNLLCTLCVTATKAVCKYYGAYCPLYKLYISYICYVSGFYSHHHGSSYHTDWFVIYYVLILFTLVVVGAGMRYCTSETRKYLSHLYTQHGELVSLIFLSFRKKCKIMNFLTNDCTKFLTWLTFGICDSNPSSLWTVTLGLARRASNMMRTLLRVCSDTPRWLPAERSALPDWTKLLSAPPMLTEWFTFPSRLHKATWCLVFLPVDSKSMPVILTSSILWKIEIL